MENCKVIAITNQKGGVGKTTTTVNFGVGLANTGNKVLLIDADPQGSLTVSLGVKNPDELDVSLSTLMQSVIEDEQPPGNAIIAHNEGVDLLPSNIELSGMETGLFNVMSREYVLKSCIEGMKKNYDYILIDCMPSLGMMTVNALAAADSVIIPSQPNFLSTKGLNLLLRSIAKIKRQINPRLRIDGILLTMVDNRTNNAKSIITSLRSSVGENIRVFESEIPFSVRAAECSLSGESIFSHDKNGKVAATYVITETTDVVVFESLYREDVEIAVHADIEDEGQSVKVYVPEIKTTASIDGRKEITTAGKVTIEDVVSYTNLIPGTEYTIRGTLMNKATGEVFTVNGETITAEVKFTPKGRNGEVKVKFVFDASGITKSTSLVVFESLYRDDVEITTHKDIEDKDQTVTITPPPDIPKTGDTTNIPLWGALTGISLLGAGVVAFFTFRKKKEENEHER